MKGLLADVPQSRMFDEMLKLLQTGHALASIEQLKELDTSKVEPMTSTVEVVMPSREDKVTDGGYAAAILANATDPVRVSTTEDMGGFFTVPKVVE
jgi:aspartyl/glutamyl-tRNA(Asn/Gln) amidotransferase C subunit